MGKRKAVDDHDSIDITGSVQCSAFPPQPEVIDLAEDSPPAPAGIVPEARHELFGYNTHSNTAWCVGRNGGNTVCSNTVGANSHDSSEEQRRKIMAHATLVNSRKRLLPPGNSQDATSPHRAKASKTQHIPVFNDSEDAAKQAIMQQAAQVPSSNSLLAQLHAERLARQQLAHPQHHDDPAGSKVPSSLHIPCQISHLTLLTYNVW